MRNYTLSLGKDGVTPILVPNTFIDIEEDKDNLNLNTIESSDRSI